MWTSDLIKTGERPEQIARRAERHQLDLSVHGPALVMDDTTAEITESSLQHVTAALKTGAQVGAGTVVIHPPRSCRRGSPPSRYWQALEAGLHRLSMVAQTEGVWLALEGMDGDKPAEVIKTPSDLRRVMALDIPRLGICLDLSHIQPIMNPMDYLSQIDTAWLRHVHLSDRSRKRHHLPLGEGEMPIVEILEGLNQCYGGPVIIEGRRKGQGERAVAGNYRYLRRRGLIGEGPTESSA